MFEDKEVIKLLREQGKLIECLSREFREFTKVFSEFLLLFLKFNRILGGEMSQIGDLDMVPIAAGQSPQYGVTPTPSGVSTFAAQTQWSSSDTTNAPVTMNASDPSGLTATVNIPAGVAAGVSFTLTWQYTNADGTVVTVTLTQTTVAPVVDVTGGTMAQIA